MKTRKPAILNRLLVLSPWLTLAILVGLSQLLPNRSDASPDAAKRKAEVAAAMESAPLFIGRWVGESAANEVPREAQELLKPNAMLSRRYSSPGGPPVTVLVVHCGDARDMLGHYPPNCYPSSGWTEAPIEGAADLNLTVGLHTLPVRQYAFRHVRDRANDDVIRIFNAFILPDGTVTRQIDDINRQSERLAVSVQGVAQLQLITSAAAPLDESVGAVNEILSGMSVMFDALKVGRGASR